MLRIGVSALICFSWIRIPKKEIEKYEQIILIPNFSKIHLYLPKCFGILLPVRGK